MWHPEYPPPLDLDDEPTNPGTSSDTYGCVPSVEDGLYCCAPCGLAVLAEHLHGRGWTGDLNAEIQSLFARGRIQTLDQVIGGQNVRLYTIVGHG